MYRGYKVQRRKSFYLTGALGAALLASGAGIGAVLTTTGPAVVPLASSSPSPTTATPSISPTTPTTGPTSTPAVVLVSHVTLAHVIGVVVAVNSNTLVVKDQSGALHTVALTSSTVFMNRSTRTVQSSVRVHTVVFVQGSWNANHQVLRASLVGIAGVVATGGDDSSGDGSRDA